MPKEGNAEKVLIRSFRTEDHGQVVRLWQLTGLAIKSSDGLPEIRKLMGQDSELFLVAESKLERELGKLVGSVIGAWDGSRGWVYHLAVLPESQKCGIGSKLVREVESRLHARGAIKVNLLVEPVNVGAIEFYEGLGYARGEYVFMGRELP